MFRKRRYVKVYKKSSFKKRVLAAAKKRRFVKNVTKVIRKNEQLKYFINPLPTFNPDSHTVPKGTFAYVGLATINNIGEGTTYNSRVGTKIRIRKWTLRMNTNWSWNKTDTTDTTNSYQQATYMHFIQALPGVTGEAQATLNTNATAAITDSGFQTVIQRLNPIYDEKYYGFRIIKSLKVDAPFMFTGYSNQDVLLGNTNFREWDKTFRVNLVRRSKFGTIWRYAKDSDTQPYNVGYGLIVANSNFKFTFGYDLNSYISFTD